MEREEQIEKQAKELLDKFANALEKAGIKETDIYVDRDEFFRKEKQGKNPDKDFKQDMLKNAPNKTSDNIIAERRSW